MLLAAMRGDAELLAAWAEGDQDAGTQVFERHFPVLYRFFSAKVADGVEDLVQETFLAAIDGRGRLADAASFRAYLFGIARNLLRGRFRKQRVRGDEVDPQAHSLADLGPGASTIVGKRREHRVLAEAMRHIPIDHQVALELYFWEKLTGPELAEALGLTEPAVRSRIHRAKAALKKEIERIAATAALVQSTWGNLDDWAADIAAELLPAARP